MPRPVARPPQVHRRRFLAGAATMAGLVAVGTSGCDAGESPTPDGSVTPTAPPVDADTTLVEATGQRIADTAAIAAACASALPSLSRASRGLGALHASHLDALGWDGEPATAGSVRRGRARSTLRRAEQTLHDQLVAAALDAGSGALAQLFASMSASLLQRTELALTPATPAGDTGGSATLPALQDTLAAEHAAVFVLGALGARTSASGSAAAYARLTDAYRTHQTRRDAVLGLVEAAGGTPRAPEPGYRLDGLTTAAQVARRARQLELSCAEVYCYLVANATGEQRGFAVTALADAAVRAAEFGAAPATLPGID